MQWTAVLRHQWLALDGLDPSESETWSAEAWSTPVDLFDDPAFCRNPPYPLENGQWLLPIYRSLEAGGAFGHDHSEMVIRLVSVWTSRWAFQTALAGCMAPSLPRAMASN